MAHTKVFRPDFTPFLNPFPAVSASQLLQTCLTRLVGNMLNVSHTGLRVIEAGSLDILDGLSFHASGQCVLKLATLALRTDGDPGRDTHSNDGGGDAHDGAVGEDALSPLDVDVLALGDGVDDLSRGRGDHVAQLVCDTRERGAESRGRKLVEVDWDNTQQW